MPERGSDGRYVKGSSGNPAGRRRGAVNKLNQEIRELIRQALDEEGGAEYLRWAAREHPVAFLSLLGRLVPAEIRGALEIVPVVSIRDYTGREHERGPRVVKGSGGVLESEPLWGSPNDQATPALGPGTVQDRQVEPERVEPVIPDHGMPPEEDELDPIPKSKPLTPSAEAALPIVRVLRPWENERPSHAETDD